MADLNGLYSFTLKDASKKKKSLDIFFVDHDSTTLAAELTNLGNLAALIDAITEAQIVEQRFTLVTPVSGALKTSPVAGSNLEEGGLFNYPMHALPGRSYSIWVPAIPDSIQLTADPKQINLADTSVSAFDTFISSSSFPQIRDDDWQTYLDAVLSGITAFRKLRRQTRRSRG